MEIKKNIIEGKITEVLKENYMPYAMSVIISRAIPEIDGLKPAHRKLLYTMYKMGLLKGDKTKCANIVGQTMKLNPHGDASIYETLVRLTTGHDALLIPYIESKGSFGKHFSRDTKYSAMRYTEAKLANNANLLFEDIDKNTVPFIDNYDSTIKEPVLLPAKYPTILANPNMGIAVGMASNICSFNLRELLAATISIIKKEKTPIEDILIAPDFSTGGELIYNKEQLAQIYKTGEGGFKVRAKYTYDKKSNCIDITEIPFTTTAEAIIDKIIKLVKENKIRDISDIRDETDLQGLKVTIDLKRGTDPVKLMNYLFQATPLTDTFSCNFNILIDGSPKVMGVEEIINEWVKFRITCIKNKLTYEIAQDKAKLHLLEGLNTILLNIDKAIKIIRKSETEKEAIQGLKEAFKIDDIQAEYIADIKLRNLNKDYILKATKHIEDFAKQIESKENLVKSDTKIKKVIIKELEEISKKYGKDRKTTLINEDKLSYTDIKEEEIKVFDVTVLLTKDGYFKKIVSHVTDLDDQKLKDGDTIIFTELCKNDDSLLVFTNKAQAYKTKLSDFNESKASSIGDYLPVKLEMDMDESINSVIITNNYKENIIASFTNGKVAKIPLSSYETKTNRKKLINATCPKQTLVSVYKTNNGENYKISSQSKTFIFNESLIPLKETKSTQGVQCMKLKDTETITELTKIKDTKGLLVVKKIPSAGRKKE